MILDDKEKLEAIEKIINEKAEECFFDEVEMCDFELNKRCKKEITEHFDKLFKDPEFARMITKAMDEAPERYGD